MKYRVIEEPYRVDLERAVNSAIEQGWKPIGGVCVNTNERRNSITTFYQAMISGGAE